MQHPGQVKKFKINLHRLRKVIEPVFNKNVGYSFILLESGHVSLDPALVSVDIFEFIDLESKEGYALQGRKFPMQ